MKAANINIRVTQSEYVVKAAPFWKFWDKDKVEVRTSFKTFDAHIDSLGRVPSELYDAVYWGLPGVKYHKSCAATLCMIRAASERSPIVVKSSINDKVKRELKLELVK